MTEAELRAQYEKDKAASAQKRKEGFMGQIVLPGEGSFEEYKNMRPREVDVTSLGAVRQPMSTVPAGDFPDPNTLTGSYAIATGTSLGQPVVGNETNANAVAQPVLKEAPGTYTIQPAVNIVSTGNDMTPSDVLPNPMNGMTPEEYQQFLANTLRNSGVDARRSTDAGLNNMAEQQNPTTPVTSDDFTDREKAQEAMAKIAAGEAGMPAGTTYTPTTQEVQQDELVEYDGLGPAPEVKTTQAVAPPDVKAPEKPDAPQVEDVPTAADKITKAEAATSEGPSEGAIISDDEVAQGVVSEGAVAKAAQGKVSKEATVQYQLGELMSSIRAGEPLPAWASGAARGATAVMQQRGLGASSMASAAMVQALMEAGIPIAQADAQTYSAMDMANLTARQQTTLANAAMFAAMDRANLDARMTAQVNNARAFLAIDTQNLTNEQQSATLSYQSAMEAVFKDQSLEYAAKQFNAQTQAQVDQFFAEMDVQVQNANANRVAAMNQFNVGEANAMTQFTASMADARDRFNTEMSVQIDQANALWRREVNTQNTALINEANRVNTQNLLGLTQNAQNALWQKYADEAAFVFEMAENESMRQHQVAMLALESKYNTDLYERQFELEGLLEIGKNAIKAWG